MNDPAQQQMIREAMKAIAERRPGRSKLVYDKAKRTIVAVAEGAQAPRALNITADDADMFSELTISADWLTSHWQELVQNRSLALRLNSWDDGDVLTQSELGPQPGPVIVAGRITLEDREPTSDQAHVRVVLKRTNSPGAAAYTAPDGTTYLPQAVHVRNGVEEPVNATLVNVQPALDTRRRALLETAVLRDSSVLCIGLGTGGAHAAIELAKSGVGEFTLVDPDRLSVGNVIRHPGGLSQVGRLKVNVVRDLILEKNPDAKVLTRAIALTAESLDAVGSLIDGVQAVICGTDSRASKLLVNRLCLEKGATAFYGGAFRRAYGGQVHRVRPGKSMCYQCFVSAKPEEADDVEVSSSAVAEGIAYSDRPVAVEPGLSLDVLPIANMVAKLALMELLLGKESSLHVLERDFAAPWYLWLNRPEPGTAYAAWPPLSESVDEMTIQRWYGIDLDRDASCPACGDFVSSAAKRLGLEPTALAVVPERVEPR